MKKINNLLQFFSGDSLKVMPLITTTIFMFFLSSVSFADNPLVSHVYTADPAARVFNGRVYVMATHDQDDQSDYSQLHDYYLFSSDDMINWQDHGIVFDARTDTSWADLAYAPDWIYKNGKYYLYFPNGGNSIGVVVSDSPEGPYTDPLGQSLINRSMPNCNVEWCFDPCVFLDDDGQAYVYFGGGGPGNTRVIQLNDDMISVKGTAVTIDAPDFFEAAYMHKRNGTYYFSYSTTFNNGAAKIDYMTSNDPMYGFQYQGTILGNPWENNGNNNHQSIIEYNDQWYIFYHNRAVANERGASTYQRSINVDRLYYNSDGTIQLVDAGPTGVPKLKNVNPFDINEAETFDKESGIETENCSEGTLNLAYLDNGDWVKISNVDFGSGAAVFEARIAATSNTSIDIVLDNLSNQPIGTLQVPTTGGYQVWQTQSTSISKVTGLHDLYLRFNGGCNVNWYTFSAGGNLPPTVHITAPSNGDEFIEGSDIIITANASDSDGSVSLVEFYANGSKIGEDSTSPYSITISDAEIGSYDITVVATDNDDTSTTSIVVAVSVIAEGENIPPSVNITSPSNGDEFIEGSDIIITANASDSDGSVSLVEFYANGSKIGEDSTSPYSITISDVEIGSYEITAVATDNEGVSTTSSRIEIAVVEEQSGDIEISYDIVNDWDAGFQGEITITNNSGTAINGWQLEFTFSGNQTIQHSWGGVAAQSGQDVTIVNEVWNGTIQPGGPVTIGFVANYSGTNTEPTQFTFNGKIIQ